MDGLCEGREIENESTRQKEGKEIEKEVDGFCDGRKVKRMKVQDRRKGRKLRKIWTNCVKEEK